MIMKHCIIFNDNQEIKRRTSGAYRFANLLESRGWVCTVVDWWSSWSERELEQYLDLIVDQDTVMFAISYTWSEPIQTHNFVAKLKQRYPGRKFIAGGQQFFQHDIGVDASLYGYSELAVDDTLAWLFDGADLPKGAVQPPELGNSILVDCNKNYAAYGLREYSIHYRPDDFLQPFELLTVELSRGCKFKCKYCNYAFLGIREDTSTQKEVLRKEFEENYRRWGITNYIIADDTFNDRTSKLEMLAEIVESLDFEMNFASFIRIDLVAANPKQMELLSRARVWNHFYGVETFHPGAGKAVGKGMAPDRIKQALLDMRSHMQQTLGLYRGTLGMIAGLPGETPESWQESELWLRENFADQSWEWWPLEISTEQNVGTISDFSRDWAKHGYSELEDLKRIDEIEKLYRRDARGIQHKKDHKSLWWSAEWADIGDAVDFVHSIRNHPFYSQELRVANFHLLNYWDEYKTHQELLALRKVPTEQGVDAEQRAKIIEPYIKSKLNSVKHLGQLKPYFKSIARESLLTAIE